ncbi:MAG TPA: helix-turn-helix domain-containing protein [Candidatus Acidoferrum sp.]
MGFSERLKKITKEFGSRYALAKATKIPASTLQSYEAGSKPGLDALATLARVANVDINWLLSGKGEMRPAGLLPGALLADVLMVDQYELGTSLPAEMVIGQTPFSRNFLEARLQLKEPAHETMLVIEAGSDLFEVNRGDFVLIDRGQANLGRDGIYLVDLPGIELRGIFRHPNGTVRVVGPERSRRFSGSDGNGRDGQRQRSPEVVMSLDELLGFRGRGGSKIIGRAVWIGRAL